MYTFTDDDSDAENESHSNRARRKKVIGMHLKDTLPSSVASSSPPKVGIDCAANSQVTA